MKRTTSFLSNLFGLLIMAALAVSLVALLRGISPDASGQLTAPLGTPTPLASLQSPLETPTTLPTAVPTTTPATVPPPPGWPTDQPWPPQPTPPKPQPTTVSRPFPTPAFPPTPRGTRPAKLQSIWFPYFPDPASSPQLREVQIDQQGQRWGQSDRRLNLSLPQPEPGSILIDLHVSPNYRWLVADFAYVGSRLVDMSTGMIQPVVADSPIEPWWFLAWTPDSQRILVSSNRDFELLNLVSGEYRTVDFPRDESHPQISAAAYSPDGSQLADAVVYPPVYQVRDDWIVEIGLRVGEDGDRHPLLRLPGGDWIAGHNLRWSPDGQKLIFAADVAQNGRHTQLWVIDMTDGTSQMLAQLAQGVQYSYPVTWSPDGRYIAALKVEPGTADGKSAFTNAYLIDAETGTEQQLTHFANRQISHLRWSPDGQWLAFTVAKEGYSELWVTNVDGKRQHPVAGPTLPNAPFAWLP